MEKRKHERFPVVVEVKVEYPEFGVFIANARDMSDGGAFLQFGSNPRRPAVGTVVTLQLARMPDGSEAPLVKGRVVRVTNDGFAVEFAENSG
jgi:hypothetical protein